MTLSKSLIFFLFLLVICATGQTAGAAILELSGPEGASVTVNGRVRGLFPLEHPLDLGPGNYLIECSLPGHKDYKSEIFLAEESDWKRLQVRMTPYSKSTAIWSNLLFAGLGQHYLDKNVRGYFYNLIEAGGLVTALVAEASRYNDRQDYLLLKDKYDQAINSNDIEYFRQKTEEAYSSMEDQKNLRNTSLYVAAGAVVVSMLDAWLFFPSLDAGPGPGPSPLMDEELSVLENRAGDYFQTVHAGIKLNF